MEYRRLGRTDLYVSAICLGTMTWGQQNSESEGHAQMDLALDHGVTFWDTAEMYAVPPNAETQGRTEEIIGTWLARRGGRDRVVLATKAIGRSNGGFGWIRGGNARADRTNITEALNDSLRRLRTDYVDLYQIHWPDRVTNRFGALYYEHRPDEDGTPLQETLQVLTDLVTSGKVRHIGVSNETAWGVMGYVHLAERLGLTRIASVQNVYNLLTRASVEVGLAEVVLREAVSLLAYSPLAGGTLTGKYLDGAMPPNSRRTIDTRPSRYDRPRAAEATRALVDMARRYGLDPAQMATAFVLHQPFVTSTIIGATSLDQLRTDIASIDVALSRQLWEELRQINSVFPVLCA